MNLRYKSDLSQLCFLIAQKIHSKCISCLLLRPQKKRKLARTPRPRHFRLYAPFISKS